ncbi:MAG: hypothetical protein RR497_00585 [Oscillospiraceae bacterium]
MKKITLLLSILITTSIALVLIINFSYKWNKYEQITSISDVDLTGCNSINISYENPQTGRIEEVQITDINVIERLILDVESIKGRKEPNKAQEYDSPPYVAITFLFGNNHESFTVKRIGKQIVVDDSYYGLETEFADWLLEYLYNI